MPALTCPETHTAPSRGSNARTPNLCKNGLHESASGTPCRECYLARQDRYNGTEKGRARWLRYYDARMDDPDPIKRFLFRSSEGLRKRRQKAQRRRAERHKRLSGEES